MRIAEVAKIESPMDRLLYWIKERYAIYLARKANQPPPWTDDEILTRYRFCNVRRMDDKVSQWLLQNWYLPYKDHPNMLAAVAMARMFNLPTTLQAVTNLVFTNTAIDWKEIKCRIHSLPRPVFNGAYVIPPCKVNNNKIDGVIDLRIKPIAKSMIPINIPTNNMQRVWQRIAEFRGYGSFLSGQVTADLRWAVSGTWHDKHTWAPVGPGSLRGLKRLGEQPNTAAMLKVIKYLSCKVPNHLAKVLEAIDYQNCLCEFDKYERALWNEGRPKQIYTPGAK